MNPKEASLLGALGYGNCCPLLDHRDLRTVVGPRPEGCYLGELINDHFIVTVVTHRDFKVSCFHWFWFGLVGWLGLKSNSICSARKTGGLRLDRRRRSTRHRRHSR